MTRNVDSLTKGDRALVALVGIWITVVWMGSDMYLPALPIMDEVFDTSEGRVNATLMAFSMALPVGALLAGPISDRSGRFVPTLVGGSVFAIANALCAASPSIGVLVAFRLLSGFGGGMVTATAMAILKDRLDGARLDTAVTVTQSLVIVGPIIAPFLGSLAIETLSWRGIFAILAVLGLACAGAYLPLGETLDKRLRADTPVIKALRLVADVARDRSFTVLLVALSLPALCFGVFLATCSYVYIDEYGLTNVRYSVFYAATSVVSIVAPFAYTALSKRVGNRRVIWVCIALLALSGVWILTAGRMGAELFLVGTFPFALAEGMARPCAYIVLLRANSERVGSASALINFAAGILSGLGTSMAMLPWSSHVVATGVPMFGSAACAAALFYVLLAKLDSRLVED